MSDLIKQAEELGIKVDKRWSDARLQQEIDDNLSGVKRDPETKLFPVKLLKNYRPIGEFKVSEEDGLRDPTADEVLKTPAGTVVHLPIEEARNTISKNISTRDDPIA